ncbi:hypothetical protein HDU96_009945 [Phlyctochytrium bullatum]|nr:hypothetical protein HDU96_009945 [Phlyctochytrium bullatum]
MTKHEDRRLTMLRALLRQEENKVGSRMQFVFKGQATGVEVVDNDRVARKVYLATWSPSLYPEPAEDDEDDDGCSVQEFMRLKYVQKMWYKNPVDVANTTLASSGASSVGGMAGAPGAGGRSLRGSLSTLNLKFAPTSAVMVPKGSSVGSFDGLKAIPEAKKADTSVLPATSTSGSILDLMASPVDTVSPQVSQVPQKPAESSTSGSSGVGSLLDDFAGLSFGPTTGSFSSTPFFATKPAAAPGASIAAFANFNSFVTTPMAPSLPVVPKTHSLPVASVLPTASAVPAVPAVPATTIDTKLSPFGSAATPATSASSPPLSNGVSPTSDKKDEDENDRYAAFRGLDAETARTAPSAFTLLPEPPKVPRDARMAGILGLQEPKSSGIGGMVGVPLPPAKPVVMAAPEPEFDPSDPYAAFRGISKEEAMLAPAFENNIRRRSSVAAMGTAFSTAAPVATGFSTGVAAPAQDDAWADFGAFTSAPPAAAAAAPAAEKSNGTNGNDFGDFGSFVDAGHASPQRKVERKPSKIADNAFADLLAGFK